jgi:hypothetical protein
MNLETEKVPNAQTRSDRKRNLIIISTLFVASLMSVGTTAVSAQDVVSEFDSDAEGWTVTGDTQGGSTPTWEGTGGNPGGHIVADDSVAGGTWYWNAPGEFLGGKSDSYDGTLEYDLRVSSTSSQFDNSDIVLEGDGKTLIYDHGDESTHPGTDWTEYEVVLNESDGGWSDENTGTSPTQPEFESVLSSLSALRIRGEYRSGSDTGRLDNVVLSGGDNGESIDDIQTSLSDTDSDGLSDRVQVDVTVSDVSSGRTTVELGESDFDVDVSTTDTNQAPFTVTQDVDGDGTPEAVQFTVLGTASDTYTVIADVSNQSDGDTGTVMVELGGGASATTIFTIMSSTGPLSPNNPFGDINNEPLSISDAADVLFQWNTNNGTVNSVDISVSEMADFLFEWNQAR